MTDFSAFTKLMPGFDFMQNLSKGAGSALPGLGQWVVPTLDPAELDKRINELRTVLFWLEQNVKMVDATVRALEVQKMTLSTLQTLNVRTEDLRQALTMPMPSLVPTPATAPAAASPGAPAVDPLQWWGALTQQFATLAAGALKDGAAAGSTAPAGAAKKAAARKTGAPAKDGGAT